MSEPSRRLDQAGGYAPHFFDRLFEVEERHFWFRARNRVITTVIHQQTRQLAAGYRVLEVGCGTGNVVRLLEQACNKGSVVGLDLFETGLRYACRRTSCPLVQGDLRKLPFRPGFSVIGLFDVLEHQSDDLGLLRDLRALLTPDGVLILTVPAHQFLLSYFDEASRHCRRYKLDDLQRKLQSVGYRVIWASPRELLNIFHAEAIGCHIITATPDILKKLPLVGKALEAYSLDTVKMFHEDAVKAGYTL